MRDVRCHLGTLNKKSLVLRAAGNASIRTAGKDTQSSSTRPKPSFCLPQIRVPGVWHLERVQLQAVERVQG